MRGLPHLTIHKRLQEYILSLQQYNSKLISDLETVRESLKRVENEKLTIVESLSTLRGHYSSLQEQLTLSRASQDDAVSQKETLVNEVKCLRGELQVRDDRECQVSKVQALPAEIEKSKSLEETCSSQREHIRILEIQLAAANEKLKMTDLSASETMVSYLEQKRIIQEFEEKAA